MRGTALSILSMWFKERYLLVTRDVRSWKKTRCFKNSLVNIRTVFHVTMLENSIRSPLRDIFVKKQKKVKMRKNPDSCCLIANEVSFYRECSSVRQEIFAPLQYK